MRVFGNCIRRAGSYQVLVGGKNCQSRGREGLENVKPQRVKHEALPASGETNTRTENVLTVTDICPGEDLRTRDDYRSVLSHSLTPRGLRRSLVNQMAALSSSEADAVASARSQAAPLHRTTSMKDAP